jgi:hypothetical protein
MTTKDEIPRRCMLDLNTPAELAIHNAIQEVEKVGADERLTDSVVYLSKAKESLSDYIDNVPKSSNELLKINAYKKGDKYHFVSTGTVLKEPIDLILTEDDYKYAIQAYKMTRIPSVFDEEYESRYI